MIRPEQTAPTVESTDVPRLYLGHLPEDWPNAGPMDVLLTVFPDGHHTIAVRPGREQGWITFGPPVDLEPLPVGVE